MLRILFSLTSFLGLIWLTKAQAVCSFDSKPISSLQGQEKKVLLTLDDGPSSSVTPKVLAILKKEGIRAVFFVVGDRCEGPKAREVLQAICDQGHTLGNHGFHHKDMRKLSYKDQYQAILQTNRLIEKHQELVFWFRPPGGSYNQDLLKVLKNQGMCLALWSVDPEDWRKPRPAPEVLTKRIVDQACAFQKNNPQKMPIILLHDIHENTAQGLQKVIDGLRAEGFSFMTPQEAEEILKKDVVN
jgi:peptidoglycan/xylan/chitin deacetylase (PgdA/CDA1 family)